MHFVSENSLKRPGYVYDEHGVGHPAESEFNVVWNHVDGPLLHTSSGRLHWLTWWERIQLHFKWTTLDRLNWKYR